ncbi:MAG TPA: GreA/GreB family elongation factor [Hydrogenophaga sp.]|uniref:GreA/GreB family elongation factor n=1 Tax=Hydrogenophaga sp. TaxID=1904254 RepID=UPI002C498D1B|nr:GreA/GreB family elongation factor [Hydrogenophaga sp.]HMN94800.1 GreA/GreB family elongation factor [Hydrogenophaga sp.]HMP12023.1 GreA/GreB family elongation factor [Hydrogenophaga sp.]
MNTQISPRERQLTELDHVRLSRLDAPTESDGLADVLANADLVPSREIGPDIVTMYSQVEVRLLRSGQRRKLTLCYPADAEPAAGFVSVFSPMGAALLGLRVGEIASWQTPGGEPVQAEVQALLFQPEASGDYLT